MILQNLTQKPKNWFKTNINLDQFLLIICIISDNNIIYMYYFSKY